MAMAFPRQSSIRRSLELSSFSFPAVVAGIALVMLHHPQNREAGKISDSGPTGTPSVIEPKPTPYDGLEPGSPLAKPDITKGQSHSITVMSGHTLWRIAREIYGNGRDYTRILDANRATIARPELIFPGQHLVLPDKKAK